MRFPLQDRIQPPIEEMYRIAKRYSRRQEEVDDLVQDLLLEAVSTGKDFSDARFMAWGRGFLRNRAAFIARTEGRRRKREEMFHGNDQNCYDPYISLLPEGFVAGLRQPLRILARLINCGLNRREILYLLNIAETALRQRLMVLRREWKIYSASKQNREHLNDPIHALSNGLIRRSLTQTLRNSADHKQHITDRIIGSHDPDGHLFIISSPHAHKKNLPGNNGNDKAG